MRRIAKLSLQPRHVLGFCFPWKHVRHASILCGPSATGPTVLHPQLTPEEEELLKKRLDVKRGAPVQDLSGRRGYPGQPGFEPR